MTLGVPGKAILEILSSREMCKIWLASGLINSRILASGLPHFLVDSGWENMGLSHLIFVIMDRIQWG